MDEVKALFAKASKLYNQSQPHYGACTELFIAAHDKLNQHSTYSHFGFFAGNPIVDYSVFSIETQSSIINSRPVRPDLYIIHRDELQTALIDFSATLATASTSWSASQCVQANRIVYTAVMAVACCYDLWQRSSRKTPGTFFEVLMAGILQKMLPSSVFTKHIPLTSLLHDQDVSTAPNELDPEEASGVSTDLVIGIPDHPGGIVVPLKITTRERIVQPFAHQRILDTAFGDGVFRSLLMCISETQLDDATKSVKQVCVPGTVKLFQKYLARIDGIYYCDLPQRYAAEDMLRTINVKSVGAFFGDVAAFFSEHKTKHS